MPPQSRKSKAEDPPPTDPKKYLEYHGEKVATVYATWSPGDSDFRYETFLFVTPDDKPKTAVVKGGTLVCRDGWDLFYVECY